MDENAEYEIKAAEQFTRCGWTPFEGWKVKGKVRKVVLRGKTAFEDGKILAPAGYGRKFGVKLPKVNNSNYPKYPIHYPKYPMPIFRGACLDKYF